MILEDDDAPIELFKDPEGFYKPEPCPTFANYEMRSKESLRLRLVGHNPLWGHLLWNGAKFLSRYLEYHRELVKDKTVLEFGAGAGLPSLVSSILGAGKVVVTDYPDADLIENLQYNIDHCGALQGKKALDGSNLIVAEPYLFGADCAPILSHLPPSEHVPTAFETLILADLLFNHSEHGALVKSIVKTMAKTSTARALVYFAPYRPLLFHRDLAFFDLARNAGLEVKKIEEHLMDTDPFPTERGDPILRRTVFGYELRWTLDDLDPNVHGDNVNIQSGTACT